ncbi:MAG TPA: hypothetical protein VEJ38_12810 [Candidatus Acidoferrales bacterium]|nr:hypothetical protein [Candidatus Acidoferrales bacterium]
MNAVPTLALVALLAWGADQQGLMQFRSQPFDSPSVTPAALESVSADTTVPDTSVQSAAHSSAPLRPESRLLLIRYVDGEFAKLVQSLPGGKKGFRLVVGKPLNMQKLNDTLRLYGTAAVRGETVQITGLEIRSDEIIVQINGGTKKHFNWRQHIQFGVGNAATPPPDVTPLVQVTGANLVLDYGRPVPDMSPDDLKHDLAAMLDFSKEHSATVNWIDTLPQQFQDAIKDHRAVVGMDSEMVLAAMGRPEHKVREKSPEGNETEDWIYGSPPARTTFVTFAGDTVIRVKEFN